MKIFCFPHQINIWSRIKCSTWTSKPESLRCLRAEPNFHCSKKHENIDLCCLLSICSADICYFPVCRRIHHSGIGLARCKSSAEAEECQGWASGQPLLAVERARLSPGRVFRPRAFTSPSIVIQRIVFHFVTGNRDILSRTRVREFIAGHASLIPFLDIACFDIAVESRSHAMENLRFLPLSITRSFYFTSRGCEHLFLSPFLAFSWVMDFHGRWQPIRKSCRLRALSIMINYKF